MRAIFSLSLLLSFDV